MITSVVNQKVSKQALINKNDKSLFSFLTDYKSTIINSSTSILQPSLQLKSRISTKGKIKFCNSDFCHATKTNSNTILDKHITSVFHPEMPKVILNIVKEKLENKEEALAIIKQIDSSGKTIWLNSQFSPNSTNKLNIACHLKSNPSSKSTINKIDKIYNTIFLLENHVSYSIAKKYFEGLLEMEYGNYEGFIINAFQ